MLIVFILRVDNRKELLRAVYSHLGITEYLLIWNIDYRFRQYDGKVIAACVYNRTDK